MKKWFLSLAVGAAMVSVPQVTMAQNEESPNTGAMFFSGGADYVTDYFFRGYRTHASGNDDGIIVQPWFEFGANLIDSDDFILAAKAGTWGSIHEQTGSSNSGKILETDYYVGLDFIFGPVTIGATYQYYTYPGDFADTTEEAGITVKYDDTQMMENANIAFTLSPYVSVYKETTDKNGTQDSYLELGLSPKFDVPVGEGKVAVSIPLAVGISLDDFYFDDDGDEETIGFLSIGVATEIPLPVPAEYGNWSVNASLTYLALIAEGLETANSGDDHEVIGKIGIGFSY